MLKPPFFLRLLGVPVVEVHVDGVDDCGGSDGKLFLKLKTSIGGIRLGVGGRMWLLCKGKPGRGGNMGGKTGGKTTCGGGSGDG